MQDQKCEGCIWFDQCGCDTVCEDYDPVQPEEEEADAEMAYELDLLERHGEYLEYVKEQDS